MPPRLGEIYTRYFTHAEVIGLASSTSWRREYSVQHAYKGKILLASLSIVYCLFWIVALRCFALLSIQSRRDEAKEEVGDGFISYVLRPRLR